MLTQLLFIMVILGFFKKLSIIKSELEYKVKISSFSLIPKVFKNNFNKPSDKGLENPENLLL